MHDIYCPWCTDGIDTAENVCGQPGCNPAIRLEYLREELRAEHISMGELHELQGLAEHIEAGDVELLEAAGVPEHPEELHVVENLETGERALSAYPDPETERIVEDI